MLHTCNTRKLTGLVVIKQTLGLSEVTYGHVCIQVTGRSGDFTIFVDGCLGLRVFLCRLGMEQPGHSCVVSDWSVSFSLLKKSMFMEEQHLPTQS